jgi:hypothetical protein
MKKEDLVKELKTYVTETYHDFLKACVAYRELSGIAFDPEAIHSSTVDDAVDDIVNNYSAKPRKILKKANQLITITSEVILKELQKVGKARPTELADNLGLINAKSRNRVASLCCDLRYKDMITGRRNSSGHAIYKLTPLGETQLATAPTVN